ncbi:MAG: hypothetical protein M1813_001277 [Trichoglossum hirsutum]|nr:MAG: hypothetical protein M1813_001277 [Trichoglossum hirsutum]
MAETSKPGNWTATGLSSSRVTTTPPPPPRITFAPVLTGTCAQPSYTLLPGGASGTVTVAPVVGCVEDRPDCCPYYVASGDQATAGFAPPPRSSGGQLLRKCPADHYSTSSGCCPSKWALWETPIGGASACFTTTSGLGVSADVIPTKDLPQSVAVATITNVVFSYHFPLEPPSSGLKTGAKVGIGVGVGCAVLIILALVYIFFMKKRKEKRGALGQGQEQPPVAVVDPTVGDPIKYRTPPPIPPLPTPRYRDDYDVYSQNPQYQSTSSYPDPRARVRQEGIFPLRPGAPPPSSFNNSYSEPPYYEQQHDLPPELGDSPAREQRREPTHFR